MEFLIKTAGVAVICAVLALVLRKNSPEMSLFLGISAVCIILYFAADIFAGISDFLKTLSKTSGISAAGITAVLKTVGIAVVTKLCADFCSDAGQKSVATSVELFGSAAAIYIALPLIKTVFQMINTFS